MSLVPFGLHWPHCEHEPEEKVGKKEEDDRSEADNDVL